MDAGGVGAGVCERGDAVTERHDDVSAHLATCRACGATRGMLCYEAEQLLKALADETARRIAPMPPIPGDA